MPILGDNVEHVPMYVHRVHHRSIYAYHSHMQGLTMFNQDRLRIGKALPINHVVGTHTANKFGILYIGMNSLSGLRGPRTRVNNERSVEAPWDLHKVIIMAVIPMRSHVLIVHREVIQKCLSWLNRLLS